MRKKKSQEDVGQGYNMGLGYYYTRNFRECKAAFGLSLITNGTNGTNGTNNANVTSSTNGTNGTNITNGE